jgi:hypothetical protein
MHKRRRYFRSFAVVALLLAATLSGVTTYGTGDAPDKAEATGRRGGYLPALGPVALRFLLPPEPPPPHVAARPAPAPVPAPTAEAQPSSATGPGYLDASSSFDIFNPLPAREYEATTSIFPPPVAQPAPPQIPVEAPQTEPAVSPEMLLRYFTRQTNGSGVSVIAPIGFTPPAPTPPPSSTATYTVGPP